MFDRPLVIVVQKVLIDGVLPPVLPDDGRVFARDLHQTMQLVLLFLVVLELALEQGQLLVCHDGLPSNSRLGLLPKTVQLFVLEYSQVVLFVFLTLLPWPCEKLSLQ